MKIFPFGISDEISIKITRQDTAICTKASTNFWSVSKSAGGKKRHDRGGRFQMVQGSTETLFKIQGKNGRELVGTVYRKNVPEWYMKCDRMFHAGEYSTKSLGNYCATCKIQV